MIGSSRHRPRARAAALACSVLCAMGAATALAPGAAAAPSRSTQIDTWASSADDLGAPYTDKTVRDIVHTSVAGDEVSVRLSNAFGTQAVTFDAYGSASRRRAPPSSRARTTRPPSAGRPRSPCRVAPRSSATRSR